MNRPDPSAPLVDSVATGFDLPPTRPVWMTVILFAVVVTVAAGFAHLFRVTSQGFLERYADTSDPTRAAERLHWWVTFATVTGAVFVAAMVGRFVEQRWGDHVGVEAVSASARGEGRSISLRATGLRGAATWVVSAGMVSIGRESAIIETGGAVGAVAGRRFRGRGDAMATAGIAAAFAAAYHAPIAALFYVEEHLRVWSSRRAVLFAVLGAIGGHAVSVGLMDGHVIFPPIQGSQWRMIEMALIALLPSVIVARAFLQLRVRITGSTLSERIGCQPWVVAAVLSVVAGGAVAVFPAAAGNGMEALRQASVAAPVSLGVALGVGKLIGTTASLGAGAPGGVLTPTISVTSGFSLLVLLALSSMGYGVEHPWDAMVATMAIGVAVGLRSPLVAVFLLPEMVGDYSLVPAIAVIVGLAVLVDRGLDRVVAALGERIPVGVYDEDA
ncbi:MAG: chloride channel protein [Ilumatobacteraceae bacterium]